MILQVGRSQHSISDLGTVSLIEGVRLVASLLSPTYGDTYPHKPIIFLFI